MYRTLVHVLHTVRPTVKIFLERGLVKLPSCLLAGFYFSGLFQASLPKRLCTELRTSVEVLHPWPDELENRHCNFRVVETP